MTDNVQSRKLTDEAVSRMRGSDQTDCHFARVYGVYPQTIRNARLGITFKTNPVAPQAARRRRGRPSKELTRLTS